LKASVRRKNGAEDESIFRYPISKGKNINISSKNVENPFDASGVGAEQGIRTTVRFSYERPLLQIVPVD
jgi:hypothetical protein